MFPILSCPIHCTFETFLQTPPKETAGTSYILHDHLNKQLGKKEQ